MTNLAKVPGQPGEAAGPEGPQSAGAEAAAAATAGSHGAATAEPAVAATKEWREVWHRFATNRLALVGTVLVLLLLATAAFAPLIAPQDPYRQDLMNTLQAPSGSHLFGTDSLGRDQFSRVVYGSRIAVLVGVASIVLTVIIGVALGAVAGYFGRFYDTLVMRVADVFFAFPLLIGSIIIITVTGRGVTPVIIALAVFGWATVARLLRSSVLSTREMDYVHAARALGAGHRRIILRHILPNSIAPVLIYATFNVGTAVVAEASLSFLGVGVSPEVPEWGNMLAVGRGFIGVYDYMWTLPSLAVVLTTLGFIFVGDGLRDALDPKLR
ncbi:ABC transporter permease [Streptacidiphilus sp. ASG 303]|uniref:ABC transporter permease n=1 Tax=Streptacidiphilus sp. ASG 303 TaxID=2896847 RepID=UPI001E4AFC75|nr:ABC transporter permease [Streptacidiphilus sp. ASG 303]MCD0486449.1 ABC transporter permease [Streptacidiphilus sp. ASG 303]